MKKLGRATFLIILVIILTCIFAACGDTDAQNESHRHRYLEKNIDSQYLVSPATCTKKAKYYYSCSCGECLFSSSLTFDYGDALGHSFTHYVSDGNATWENDGTKTAKCDRCNEINTIVDVGSCLSNVEDNFSLTLTGNTYAITAYIGNLTKVRVPSTYQGKQIVSIGTRAFYDCSKIIEVSLPDTINEIGEEAFGYCTSLKKIDISACKRIKDQAFIGCTSLTEMTIPNGVISIGAKPFSECSSLKKVTIYSGEISAKVFAGNKYVEEIILGENVSDVAQFAFSGCTALKKLTMPKVNDMQAFITYYFGLEAYNYTLSGSGTSKIVPERVKTYVYETNGVKHVFGIPVDGTNWYYDGDGIEVGGVYYKYTGKPVTVSSWKDYYEVTINLAYQLPSSWKAEFYYMPNLSLQELTITDQLISTKDDVFKGLTCKIDVKQKYPVKSVSLVGNTEVFVDEFSISNYMLRVEHTDGFVEDILFEEKYLQSDINDLKTSGKKTLSFVYDGVSGEFTILLKLHTFENVSMDDVLVFYNNMPKSLAVSGAPDGTIITYENNNQIEDGDYIVKATLVKPYYETKVLTATLSIRKEAYSIKYVFNNDEAVNDNPSEYRYGAVTRLNIPSSKSGTFVRWYEDENYSRSFNGITETTYGNLVLYGKFSSIFTVSGSTITGLTDIGKTFTEIVIPQQINGTTIKNIADSAFKDCTGLTDITIPDSVTSIGDYAFYGCTGLTSITILDGVTSIGASAFRGCTGLTSITIPDSVTSIGYDAFWDCTGLTSITIPDNVTSIGDAAFYGCSGLTSVIIPDGVASIGSSAFSGCTGLTGITIPDGVTSIGYATFYSCTGLTSITIPDGVTSIGSSAFFGCTGLTSITIPDSVTSIGQYAFYNTAWYNNQPDGLVYAGKVAYKYKGTMPSNTSIVLKEGTLGIGSFAFDGCTGLTSITFNGTKTQWRAINKGYNWKYNVPNTCKIVCTDGTI